MLPLAALKQVPLARLLPPADAVSSLIVRPLTYEDTTEVLSFLAARPLHTVFMASLIRDNGPVSNLNRGTFYACRNQEGQLEGVALIGHATLLDARTEATLQAFANLTQDCPSAHMIMGEQEKIERFRDYYSKDDRSPRLLCRELLLEQCWPVEVREVVPGLRPATLDDLSIVMPVQAELAVLESGINPMETDPTGFRLRCARRIEQGRVWVWVENEKLIFKADVQADTPEIVYLEGIYVDPEERGKGCGLRCMSQLSRMLLQRSKSLCLLVNEQNHSARRFYQKAGYKFRSYYDTIFLQQRG